MESILSEIGPITGIIDAALAEDLASGDVTGRVTVPAHTRWRARLVAKEKLVMAGGAVARAVLHRVDAEIAVEVHLRESEVAAPGTVLMDVEGNARSLLAAERTMLNLFQRMCGVATATRAYVDAAAGRCRICDTRKTMPGLRALDRYAVRCGGGHNHRNDLGAGVLIKENHVRAAGGISEAIARARVHAPHSLRVECEVTDFAELREALKAGADAVLLDNMDDAQVREAVAIVAGKAIIEVSGGVSLDRITLLAGMGIDVISVGRLTHSAPASDISLLFALGDGGWG